MNYKFHGLLLLDKPINLSSNAVLQKVRCLLNEKKAGYIGTLDPIASGMLPICFGNAKKFSQFISNSNKRYHVIARLGQSTDTMDAYGKIVNICSIDKITEQQLNDALDNLHSTVTQVTPMYSAVKFHGKPLYQYAREGIDIKGKLRKIVVYEIKCNSWNGDIVDLEIYCSKGTYIRVLIDELGKMLGCGAHVIYLRRIQIGNYFSNNMVTLDMLYNILNNNSSFFSFKKKINSLLLPIETMLTMLDEINISSLSSMYFQKGGSINVKHNFKIGDKIRVIESKFNKFIGVAKIDKFNRLIPIYLPNHYG